MREGGGGAAASGGSKPRGGPGKCLRLRTASSITGSASRSYRNAARMCYEPEQREQQGNSQSHSHARRSNAADRTPRDLYVCQEGSPRSSALPRSAQSMVRGKVLQAVKRKLPSALKDTNQTFQEARRLTLAYTTLTLPYSPSRTTKFFLMRTNSNARRERVRQFELAKKEQTEAQVAKKGWSVKATKGHENGQKRACSLAKVQ